MCHICNHTIYYILFLSNTCKHIYLFLHQEKRTFISFYRFGDRCCSDLICYNLSSLEFVWVCLHCEVVEQDLAFKSRKLITWVVSQIRHQLDFSQSSAECHHSSAAGTYHSKISKPRAVIIFKSTSCFSMSLVLSCFRVPHFLFSPVLQSSPSALWNSLSLVSRNTPQQLQCILALPTTCQIDSINSIRISNQTIKWQ